MNRKQKCISIHITKKKTLQQREKYEFFVRLLKFIKKYSWVFSDVFGSFKGMMSLSSHFNLCSVTNLIARARQRCLVCLCVCESKFVNVKVLTSQHEFTHISINYQLTDGQTLAKRGYKWIIHIEKYVQIHSTGLTLLGGKTEKKLCTYFVCSSFHLDFVTGGQVSKFSTKNGKTL